jgi:hypothetical protein
MFSTTPRWSLIEISSPILNGRSKRRYVPAKKLLRMSWSARLMPIPITPTNVTSVVGGTPSVSRTVIPPRTKMPMATARPMIRRMWASAPVRSVANSNQERATRAATKVSRIRIVALASGTPMATASAGQFS